MASPRGAAVEDFDGDGAAELAVDLGPTGAQLYDQGSWAQLTSSNPKSMTAADIRGESVDEALADLGTGGLDPD